MGVKRSHADPWWHHMDTHLLRWQWSTSRLSHVAGKCCHFHWAASGISGLTWGKMVVRNSCKTCHHNHRLPAIPCVILIFFWITVFFYYRWGQENLLLSSFQWFSKLSFPAVSRLLWHAQVWDEGTMETHGKCNKLVQGKMLKFRILASPKQPFPLSVTFALVVGVDALLYLRGQLILLTGEPVFPSWCNPFYMNLSSGGGKNGNYQQTKGAAALRQSSFLQSCLCQTHVKDRNNIHSNAISANSFRRRRV